MSLCSGQITGDISLANVYQLINCCNILCDRICDNVPLFHIRVLQTEYAWSSYMYLSSCTYMQTAQLIFHAWPPHFPYASYATASIFWIMYRTPLKLMFVANSNLDLHLPFFTRTCIRMYISYMHARGTWFSSFNHHSTT